MIEPDWSGGVREAMDFASRIFASRDGTERRRALRSVPRRSLEFATLDDRGRARAIARSLLARDARPDALADPIGALGTVVEGRYAASTALGWATDRVLQARVRFEQAPGSPIPLVEGAALPTLGGLPLLDLDPDWSRAVEAGHDLPVETADEGAAVAFYTAPRAPRLTIALEHVGDRAEVGAVRSLFLALRGRWGEAHVPTWTADLRLAAPLVQGDGTLLVDGVGAWRFSAVHLALLDGRRLARRVVGSAPEGEMTRLTLASPATLSCEPAEVDRLGWAPRCRLASDELSIEWITDAVGRVGTTWITLDAERA